ncbi:DUF1493 family protein [Pantoea agglomerans]|uniref:DUF1493 family protein n=1 Tax=Enterobacter agglomerans TaxID=549 RepID=UPI0020325894|nr:DUF1493 family protein [Pantoea agglomerans]MDH1168667.1 DUF1493 family protein [Pantoea agglomerans]URW93766.1 DUF1493 family protein [Pantoea agglomerans]
MVSEDVEKAVFALVEDYNGRSLFTLRRYKLELDTDLNNDFRMDPLDAYELLERYADRFGINPGSITFAEYFPEDFNAPHDPLTIRLLIESAQARRWLGK